MASGDSVSVGNFIPQSPNPSINLAILNRSIASPIAILNPHSSILNNAGTIATATLSHPYFVSGGV